MVKQGSITLHGHIVIDKNMSYRKRAELMLKEAREASVGGTDNKCYTTLTGIESLIGAGAEIIGLNESRGPGKPMVHEVVYQGQIFITTSGKPFAYIIEARLK